MRKIIAIVLIIFLSTPPLYANDFLYRVDTRPPEEIFINGSQGFNARGANYNLSMHVSGATASINGSGSTGLISVTDNLTWANSYARRLLDWNLAELGLESRDVYIYQIAQTRGFYNVQRSLQENDPNIVSSIRQGEWVVENTIPQNLIMGAWHLYDHGPAGAARDTSQANFLSNSRYNPGTNAGTNLEPYNGGQNPIYQRDPLAVSLSPLVLLPLSATLWCRDTSDSYLRSNTCSEQTEKYFNTRTLINMALHPRDFLINPEFIE